MENAHGVSMMREFSDRGPLRVELFILRNLALYFLMFNSFIHFEDQLSLVFLSVVFFCSAALAVGTHLLKLRFFPSCVLFILTAFLSRILFFMLFSLLTSPDKISEGDFLFFYFDKEFFPALIPGFFCWLFNTLALRNKKFVFIEVILNALLLMIIFITEAGFRVSLYSPPLFAGLLLFFIFIELRVLNLSWKKRQPVKHRNSILQAAFVVLPLLLLVFINSRIFEDYNRQSVKNQSGLMESTLFGFDFSRYVQLEDEIRLNQDLVLLMRKDGPGGKILLKRYTLSLYKPGQGFLPSGEYDHELDKLPAAYTKLEDPLYKGRKPVSQEYYMINIDPESFISMNYPVEIIPMKKWGGSSFSAIYQVTSMVEDETGLYLDQLPSMNPESYRFYTDYQEDQLIREKAEEITEGIESYSGKVLAIENYLQRNYEYSLKPGVSGGDEDKLHYFLFKSRKGYCSYFAFAMALMCRSLGIPARVVVGFASDPNWTVMNFYEIRGTMAHAWVEVFFGDYGWRQFDPTSSRIAAGENIEFLTDFTPDRRMKSLITEIINNEESLKEQDRLLEEKRNGRPNFILEAFSSVLIIIARLWFLLLPCFYFIFVLFWRLHYYVRYRLLPPGREKIKCLYRHSLVMLYKVGFFVGPEETPLEYSVRAVESSNIELTELTELYLKAAFADTFSEEDCRSANVKYAAFKASYEKRFNLFIRGAAWLSPLHIFLRKGL